MADEVNIEDFANQQYQLLMSGDQAALLQGILAHWLSDYGNEEPEAADLVKAMKVVRIR